MKIRKESLRKQNMYMPAEFDKQHGVIMIWPVRAGSWGRNPEPAKRAFLEIALKLVEAEHVYLLVDAEHRQDAEQAAQRAVEEDEVAKRAVQERLHILVIESDDAWARDVAPTFVTNGRQVCGISWQFNAWGGKVDGLYQSWDKDNALAQTFCEQAGYDCYVEPDFVLEGGSIHSDGEGTLLVTESCLLSKGRNPLLSKQQIEDKLKEMLGAKKVLWLPRGIYQDETNEHVDNVCAFVKPGEVVLAWIEDKEDPQYELSQLDYAYLQTETDAKGRKLKIHKLPIPDKTVCVEAEDCEAYVFEEGEAEREVGERLAASYVNYFAGNKSVLVPQFGGENRESDKRALDILKALYPDREVVGIHSMAILLGGGNIHCITQQIPEGKGNENEQN